MKSKLSTLWMFATLNYLYCDVVSLMDHNLLRQYLVGRINGIDVSQGFLLAAGILVEVPIAMVLLSRILQHRVNRWANIVAGGVMTVVQTASLLAGSPASYYVFFSAIEILTTAVTVWLAWRWAAAPIVNQPATSISLEPN